MIKRKLKLIAVVLCIFSFMISSVSAAYIPSDAATLQTMSNGGNTYIYSDNPEMLWDGTTSNPGSWVNNFSGRSGAYTIEQALTSNTMYDAYFYHINKTQSKTIKVGVYLYTTSGTATATIYNKKVVSKDNSSLTDDAMCASVETGYQQSTNYQTLNITTDGTFIAYDTISPLKLINGHVMFKTTSSNIKCRIVFLDSTSSVNPKTFGKATAMSSGVTGLFPCDVKYVSYNYSNVAPSGKHGFYLALAGSAMGNNAGEYDTGLNTINGNTELQGNYGIVYNMVLSGCAGKTIRITADWDSIWSSSSGTWCVCETFAYCPGGSTSSWTSQRIHSIYNKRDSTNTKTAYTGSEPTYIDVPVPAGDSSYNFKFILPGSNFGNVYFRII